MSLSKKFSGKTIGGLRALRSEAEAMIDAIDVESRNLFNKALMLFTGKPTEEVREIDTKLNGHLVDVFKRIGNIDQDIILGSLYNLQCVFGEDVDMVSLLVDTGLFSKIFYHHDTLHGHQSHQFDDEADMLDCIETCTTTGKKSYYDPLRGIEVSKETFERNTYFTLMPTTLYKKLYSELLEVYENLTVV